MTLIAARNLAMSFQGRTVFENVSLSVESGERLAILGASGSGKTTLLRLLAGLQKPVSGTLTHSPDLRIGMVFQDLALWPNLSALENVAIVLGKLSKPKKIAAARAALAACHIEELGFRKPPTLSIGQQQRVALARAIAARPDLLLLDEPFSSLDPLLREELVTETRRLADQQNAALVIVTHNPFEATALAQNALVLQDAHVAEAGPLATLLAAPRSKLLRQFKSSLDIQPEQPPPK